MYRDYTNIQRIYVTLVAQSRLTLCDSVDYSPPGSPVHGILQARILEGLPFPSPGESSQSRIEPVSPALQAVSLPLDQEGRPTLAISYCFTICFEMLSAFLFFPSWWAGRETKVRLFIASSALAEIQTISGLNRACFPTVVRNSFKLHTYSHPCTPKRESNRNIVGKMLNKYSK